jgi:hypothetical protein
MVSDQPIGGGFYARSLTYRLVNDRLVAIEFRTSVDGFAFAVARLKHEFGPPTDIRRDTANLDGRAFDHVAFTWRNGHSTIVLSDPTAPDKVSVTMELNDVPSRPRVSASVASTPAGCTGGTIVNAPGVVRSCK